MADYRNTGRLFKNDHKKTDKHPDYTGDYTDGNGDKKKVAAWIKEGTNGRGKWMSFKISDMENQERHDSTGEESQDSDVPF